MNPNDLKKILKPLVKALVKEAMQEELSTVISEIIKQTSNVTPIVERRQPTIDPRLQEERAIAKQQAQNERKKMLEELSKKSYGGVNIFEGTTPLAKGGEIRESKSSAPAAAEPLAGVDPHDPGVDIGGLLKLTGGWRQIK
jgi:hypothetical protein